MAVHPILSALRRHKAGVVLIVLQIALTLAIVCNAVFIIAQRIERLSRPTGIEESNLIRVAQAWVGAPSGDDTASIEKLDALQRADLDTLRNLPGVKEVAASESLPIQGMIWSGDVTLTPDQKGVAVQAAYYYGDEHMRSTLGVHLIAGRDFNAGEILHRTIRGTEASPVIIVTKPVADKLFPQGDALGRTVYLDGKTQPSTIVGIIEQLQTPTTDSWGNPFAYNSVLEPVRLDGTSASYAVRTQPGREEDVMHAARKALFAANPMRIMPDTWGTQTFSEIRAKVYRADRGMAILMGVVCLILLGVTAAGIVGLTSFWVGQRHRQIGVRRALGARRIDILHYFQIENLLIAGVGVVLGVVLAVGLNLWLMAHYEMERLPLSYVLSGVLAVLVIGQGAVFVPARRASNVPPVVATRAA
jgi:putative ABC transport system permease protein